MNFLKKMKYMFFMVGLLFGSMYAMDIMDSPICNPNTLNSFQAMYIASELENNENLNISSSSSSSFDVMNIRNNLFSQDETSGKKVKDLELTKKRKLESDQARNKKTSEKIRSVLKDVSNNANVTIESPEAKIIIKDFNYMQDTPGYTKKLTANYIANELKSGSIDHKADSITKNNQLKKHYKTNKKKSKIIATVAPHLSSPVFRDLLVVDTDHILNPDFKYDNTGDLLNINGGHSPEEYVRRRLFDDLEHVFIGQDNITIGIDVKGKVQKSMIHGMTEASIVDDLKSGVIASIDPDSKKLKINQISNSDRYVGAYQDSENPLIFSTIFPLLTVINKDKNAQGDIYVGKFSRLNNDGSIDKSFKQEINISINDFKNMMESGKKFISYQNDLSITDITVPLEKYCMADLKNLGINRFPATVYGIQDYRNSHTK